jgi:hypothetical protein
LECGDLSPLSISFCVVWREIVLMARTVKIGFSGETETDQWFSCRVITRERESGDKSPHSKGRLLKDDHTIGELVNS